MTTHEYISFCLSDEEYAFNIIQIQEIRRLKETSISPVPGVFDYILGILNMRGEVVPVVDLRKKLQNEKSIIQKESRIIILSTENKYVGFLVDRVKGVINLEEKDITEPAEETKMLSPYIKNIGMIDKHVIFVLDPEILAGS